MEAAIQSVCSQIRQCRRSGGALGQMRTLQHVFVAQAITNTAELRKALPNVIGHSVGAQQAPTSMQPQTDTRRFEICCERAGA